MLFTKIQQKLERELYEIFHKRRRLFLLPFSLRFGIYSSEVLSSRQRMERSMKMENFCCTETQREKERERDNVSNEIDG